MNLGLGFKVGAPLVLVMKKNVLADEEADEMASLIIADGD